MLCCGKFSYIYYFTVLNYFCNTVHSFCSIERFSKEGNGFHRTIRTIIKIEADIVESKKVLLIENISSNFYVDAYQVASMFQFDKQEVYMPQVIDLEKSDYESQNYRIMVYNESYEIDNLQSVIFTLPIHIRYHMPDSEKPYKKIKLLYPDVFVSANKDSSEMAELPCYENFTINCKWIHLNCDRTSDKIYFKVPIGMKKHYNIVFVVTYFTIIISMIAHIYGLNKK